jgi:hypothetical protein
MGPGGRSTTNGEMESAAVVHTAGKIKDGYRR